MGDGFAVAGDPDEGADPRLTALVAERAQEPRLSDARRTRDEKQAARAGLRGSQPRAQRVECVAASDERRREGSTALSFERLVRGRRRRGRRDTRALPRCRAGLRLRFASTEQIAREAVAAAKPLPFTVQCSRFSVQLGSRLFVITPSERTRTVILRRSRRISATSRVNSEMLRSRSA